MSQIIFFYLCSFTYFPFVYVISRLALLTMYFCWVILGLCHIISRFVYLVFFFVSQAMIKSYKFEVVQKNLYTEWLRTQMTAYILETQVCLNIFSWLSNKKWDKHISTFTVRSEISTKIRTLHLWYRIQSHFLTHHVSSEWYIGTHADKEDHTIASSKY